MTHIMTIASFRAQPRVGHLDCLKRMYGYVYKTRKYSLKYRTGIQDITEFNSRIRMDWTKSTYGDCVEEIQDDAPKLL